MIRLEKASVVFSGRPLFADLTWQITEEARVGLVGVNGSGKSTLLRVITGEQAIDGGEIIRSKNFTIGYLPQELKSVSDKTVFEEALSGCGTAHEIRQRIEETEIELQHSDPNDEQYHELVHEYGRLHHLFEELDGFSLDSKTARVLDGLAIPREWWSLAMHELSGGWQMRVQLAKLILAAPSLLLLDEPTNHLDVESIVWLSSFLRNYEGGLIVISHDRYFLDENVRETVEIWNGKLHFYAGNYSYYTREKENRKKLLEAAYKNQQEEIARIQEFIERFRYKATKARQVQSRIKMLEKIERIEVPQETDRIRLRIPESPRSGRTVLEASQLTHSYGAKTVFSNLNFAIERGERIALVGQNGAGKTTLLKILAGIIKPSHGEVRLGHNVDAAYYSQVVTDQMKLQNSVYDELASHAADQDQTQLRTLLGCFLFSGEDVYKKISVLSGGEKSRVALAKILLKRSNLLLLDEPTNHLDLNSKEILLDALQQYNGAILFIAHDRYFMDVLAQKVLELKNGELHTYLGNYAQYLEKISAEPQVVIEPPKEAHAFKTKDQKRQEAQQRQQQSIWKKQVLEPLQKLEATISANEQRIGEIESTLAQSQTALNKDQLHLTIQEYESLKKTLEHQYEEWARLQSKANEP